MQLATMDGSHYSQDPRTGVSFFVDWVLTAGVHYYLKTTERGELNSINKPDSTSEIRRLGCPTPVRKAVPGVQAAVQRRGGSRWSRRQSRHR